MFRNYITVLYVNIIISDQLIPQHSHMAVHIFHNKLRTITLSHNNFCSNTAKYDNKKRNCYT